MNLHPNTLRRLRIAARAAYVGVVLLATLTHLHIDGRPAWVLWRLHRALHWASSGSDVVDAARNVALFAGFGAVWLVTSTEGQEWRTVLRITLEGFALSLSVECVQLFSLSRFSSINDIATNTLGALLGSGMLVLAVHLLRRARGVRTVTGVPMFAIALAYVGAVTAEAFSPLYRRDMNPWTGGGIGARLANALHYVRLFDVVRMSLLDVGLFAPAGVLAVVALAELGLPYGAASVIVIAGGIAWPLVVEVLHGIAGQPIDVSAVASHALGIAIGAVVAWRWVPPVAARAGGRARARLALALYSLLLLAWAWRPFVPRVASEIRGQLTARHLTPLGVLGATGDLFGVMDVAEQFFLYLPLGLLLARWPVRRRGWLAGALPGIWLAVVLEVGQLFVRDRIFDVTDLLTQCGAVAVGYVVAVWAGWGADDREPPAEARALESAEVEDGERRAAPTPRRLEEGRASG